MKSTFLNSLFILSVLFISCSSDDDTAVSEDQGEEQGTLKTLTDVNFELPSSTNLDPVLFYSTSKEEAYKLSELSTANIADIDIMSATNQVFIAFESPSVLVDAFATASATKFQYSNVPLTVADFDAMTDDSELKGLTVVHEDEALSTTFREVILFENAAGKIGAIKVKAINATRLQVDIKVQK